MWQQKMSFVFTLLYTRGLDSAIYRVVTEQQEILPISQPSRLRISQAWWNPITYSVVPDKCIPCCGKYYCTLGCARIKWADTHRSLEDPCRKFYFAEEKLGLLSQFYLPEEPVYLQKLATRGQQNGVLVALSLPPPPPHSFLTALEKCLCCMFGF